MISTIRTSLSSKRLSPRVCLRRPPLTNLLFVLFSLSLFSPSKNSICDLAQYRHIGIREDYIDMPTNATPLTRRPAWKALEEHYQKIRHVHSHTLFAEDPKRGQRLALEAAPL